MESGNVREINIAMLDGRWGGAVGQYSHSCSDIGHTYSGLMQGRDCYECK